MSRPQRAAARRPRAAQRPDRAGAPARTDTRKVLSPSRIARFYFHECERFLRYAATPSAARAADGVPRPPIDTRPVTRAILESGYAWEEEVVRDLLRGRVHVGPADASTALSDRVIDVRRAREILTTVGPGEVLYQPELEVPSTFYERYGHDADVIRWSNCRPDLIETVEADDGTVELRVIDVKASPGVKLSHRIQATLRSPASGSLSSRTPSTSTCGCCARRSSSFSPTTCRH
jgi:DNA replication ATP-dependent helicase Dna2